MTISNIVDVDHSNSNLSIEQFNLRVSKERRKRQYSQFTVKPKPDFFASVHSDIVENLHGNIFTDSRVRRPFEMGNIGGRFSVHQQEEVSQDAGKKRFSLGYQIRKKFEEADKEIPDGTLQNTLKNLFKEHKG